MPWKNRNRWGRRGVKILTFVACILLAILMAMAMWFFNHSHM